MDEREELDCAAANESSVTPDTSGKQPPEASVATEGRGESEDNPNRSVIQSLISTAQVFLHMNDWAALELVVCLMVTHRFPDTDPVWGFLVGPPSSAKTELIGACSTCSDTEMVSSLTPQALVSGSTSNAGMLRRIGSGVVLLKDFTTVLEMNRDARGEVLAQLREVYDGSYTKHFGNTVGVVHWSGRITVIAGVTMAIDSHHQAMARLGPRFVMVRLGAEDREAVARLALRTSNASEHRRALSQHLEERLSSLEVPPLASFELADAVGTRLYRIADLAARARSHVPRDGRSRDVVGVASIEGIPRVLKQLQSLSVARAVADGRRGLGDDDLAFVTRVAMDSVSPPLRMSVMRAMAGETRPLSVKDVAALVGVAVTTTRRTLEDLHLLELADRTKVGKQYEYTLIEWAADLLAGL